MKTIAGAKKQQADLEKYTEAAKWSRRWYQFMPRDMRVTGQNPKPSDKACDFYEVFFGKTEGKYPGKEKFDAKSVVWQRGIDTKQWYKIIEEAQEEAKSPTKPAQATSVPEKSTNFPRPSITVTPSDPYSPTKTSPDKPKKPKTGKFLGVGNGLRLLRHKGHKSAEKPKLAEKPVIKPEDYKLDLQFADNVFPDGLGDFVLDKLRKGEEIGANFKEIEKNDKKERDRLLLEKKVEMKKLEDDEAERKRIELEERKKLTAPKRRYVREYETGYIDDDDLKPVFRYGPGTGNALGNKMNIPDDDKPNRLIVRFMQAHPEFSQNNHSTNLFTEAFEKWKKLEMEKNKHRNDLI